MRASILVAMLSSVRLSLEHNKGLLTYLLTYFLIVSCVLVIKFF